MKIKSIESFTLDECQDYLVANPDGDLAQEVMQKMKCVKQLNDKKLQKNKALLINEFNTEFNRYFATQRYEDAFAVCLKYIRKVDSKTEIINKADRVIQKLKNSMCLPPSVSISDDWLIDQLVLNGYSNMKYDGVNIKWRSSSVRLMNYGTASRIRTACSINVFSRIVIFIVLTFINGLIIPMTADPIGREICSNMSWSHYKSFYYDDFLKLGIVIAIVFFITWISIYVKKLIQHKILLRKIAKITIDHFSE